MIPYIIELSDKDFTIGFERVDVPPYLVHKENGAIDAETFAMTLKSAVLGLNSLCHQETPDIILVYPQSMGHIELMKYIYSCKKYDIIIRRTLSNTSAIALTKLVQTNKDMSVLVVVREKDGYSTGFYELCYGVCESLGQGFCRDENDVLEWINSFVMEAPEHFMVVSPYSIDSFLFEREWKISLDIEYVPESTIISGGAIMSNILMGNTKHADSILLDSINGSFGLLLYGSRHNVISNDTTIPCKQTISLSSSRSNQQKIVLCFTINRKEIIGAISVVRPTPFDPHKPEVEVSFDLDANKKLKIEIKDLSSGKTKTYRAFDDLPPFNLSVNEIIKYLPSLYNEEKERLIKEAKIKS